MVQYTLSRIISTIPVLLGVLIVTFILMYIVPGDPVLSMVGERYDEVQLEKLREDLNLNEPLIIQFGLYIKNILKGDFGNSFVTQRPVLKSIMHTFPKTLRLAFAAMIIATIIGIITGIISAVLPGTIWDRICMLGALGGVSIPVFWLALLLIWFIAVYLRLLPPSGYGGGSLKYLILPSIALSTQSAAYIARITRAYMLEIMSAQFITTARAKGLSEFMVIGKHGLRNVLIPVITIIGSDFGSYLSGSVLTESIFGWPGLGRFTLEAILQRDFPVIQGAVLTMAFMFVFINLAVDLLYGYIDPRVSVGNNL